jgi:hypothetical protein
MNGATPRGAPNLPPPIADATDYLNPFPFVVYADPVDCRGARI